MNLTATCDNGSISKDFACHEYSKIKSIIYGSGIILFGIPIIWYLMIYKALFKTARRDEDMKLNIASLSKKMKILFFAMFGMIILTGATVWFTSTSVSDEYLRLAIIDASNENDCKVLSASLTENKKDYEDALKTPEIKPNAGIITLYETQQNRFTELICGELP